MTSFFIVPIVDKRRLKELDLEAVIMQALQLEAERAKRQYERTVASWTRKPDFELIVDDFEILVGTDNKIYGYVDRGTKPHPIAPKRAPFLQFQTGYKPKTQVNRIGSNAGGSFGNTVRALEVQHPGTEARNFTERIQYQAQRVIQKNIQREINKAVKRSR